MHNTSGGRHRYAGVNIEMLFYLKNNTSRRLTLFIILVIICTYVLIASEQPEK